MAIVKNIVTAHKGQVEYYNNLSNGVTFRIILHEEKTRTETPMSEEKLPYHTLSPTQVMEILDVGSTGLNGDQVKERQGRFGPNELAAGKKISALTIFFRQFHNFLIIILLIAAGLTFFLEDLLDGAVILAIVLLCTILGFIQEYRAERAAAALKKLAAPETTVLREGNEQVIPANEVVPGDILVLHTGDRVAADGRILEAINLKADEALLTGESKPGGKMVAPDPRPLLAIADQKGMVFGGTVINYGRGKALVTATGMDTEFGHIARLLAEVTPEKSPLEKRMATIGRVLAVIALTVGIGVAVLKFMRGYEWLPILMWVISLAVATVPESLPTVITGALAIGTSRMARRKAIVKRLPAVETLGCTTVICTDKTGTLTKNEMTARNLLIDDRKLRVSGLGYQPEGAFYQGNDEVTADNDQVLKVAARIGVLCNDAVLEEVEGKWIVRGDSTEGALLVMGRKAGLDPALMVQEFPRVAEVPFSSERKRMTTVHRGLAGIMACLKGAPETILSRCTRILTGHGERLLTEGDRQEIIDQAEQMAAGALRVLGLAHRVLEMIPESSLEDVEADLVWVGLVGLMDPPRPEAQETIAKCRQAGIRVIMITGDHPDTALAISREIGLTSPNQHDTAVLSGADLNRMSDDDLLKALNQVLVFARVAPAHKLRLVNLLKAQDEVVAMTGDGVNDAPALKKADIGVAMGITGTEVTKETADIILADDNFATLVAAVEEGRTIFDNIKKYLIFLLSCNLTLILILTVTLFFGMPLPLLAFQILWVNVIIDGPPALALGVDPKTPDIMSRPPRPRDEGIFTQSVIILIGVITVYLASALTLLYSYYLYANPGDLLDPDAIAVRARTMMFLTMMLAMLINAFNCRSDSHSLFTVGFLANRYLVVSVVLGLVMAVAVVQWPPLALLFHTVPLTLMDWLYVALVSILLIPVVELAKWVLRLSKSETKAHGGEGFEDYCAK